MLNLGPGDVVNGYRIEHELGRGAMGVVYEAVQLSLERRVALKVISSSLAAEPEFRHRFQREALVQASVTHPHIVTVHDAGEIDGTPYIVMRLIRGRTLRELMNVPPLPLERLLYLLAQVADALDAAHAMDLIHRDVKPQNVLVRGGTKAYLADFGLTRAVSDTGFTATGQFLGTVRYVSPEQIVGGKVTGAADNYSLGVVLYEGLTGRAPFDRSSEIATLWAHSNEPPPKPSQSNPSLPAAVDEVTARAMAKDPAQRYPTAIEMIDATRDALGLERPAF